jgi:hypothetical protein
MDLLVAYPAIFNAPNVDFVEDRQHCGAGPHSEGRGLQGKGSPREGREDPPSSPPASTSSPARLHPFRGECAGGCSFEVSVGPGLAPRPHCISPDIISVGSTPDRPVRVSPVSADSALYVLESRGQTRSHRRAQHEVGLALAFLFPPIPLLKRVIRKLEFSRGMFLLVAPYWEAQSWFASLQALQVEDVRHLPFSDDLVIDLTTGEPSPNLERLFLVVWKILGGLGELTPSQTGTSDLFRQDGSDPQKTATKELGSPLRPSSALPPFLSIRRL